MLPGVQLRELKRKRQQMEAEQQARKAMPPPPVAPPPRNQHAKSVDAGLPSDFFDPPSLSAPQPVTTHPRPSNRAHIHPHTPPARARSPARSLARAGIRAHKHTSFGSVAIITCTSAHIAQKQCAATCTQAFVHRHAQLWFAHCITGVPAMQSNTVSATNLRASTGEPTLLGSRVRSR